MFEMIIGLFLLFVMTGSLIVGIYWVILILNKKYDVNKIVLPQEKNIVIELKNYNETSATKIDKTLIQSKDISKQYDIPIVTSNIPKVETSFKGKRIGQKHE